MGLADINQVIDEGHKSKGGLWGSIAGGLLAAAGAVAAPFTGGTSLSAVPAGLALAGTAAPIIGNALDPSKDPTATAEIPHSNTDKSPLEAIAMHPEVQLAGLTEAKNALKNASGMPSEQVNQLSQTFDNAAGKLKNQLGINK